MSSDFYTSSILPYSGIIINICRAYTDSQEDFEDYYQEVCLQIWRSKDKFRGDSKWSTWIYRLTLNICLTLVKKKKKTRQYYSADSIINNEDDDNNTFFSDSDLDLLYDAIKQLSEVDRAIILFYLEEKPNKEIAEIIGTTPNNIGVRVNRIKKRLKKLLDGKIN
ncbi:RNA polymerase sigma-70 factor (ECF subfamily) [Wenyingzhuangia heitensis]|uniref:RNA polymerase sigma-70 factor (ECF subfamily) n=1 Tax=Wenyingzhuangia heitensis TaxID=1487859 RepID=A0ABX0UDV5_9FLAO|nr:sigma-70 family RNA polymerase sigma factor [Wenyingzhuangia heitensis]NIJ46608.1 RNA polymerase sigma-70 factor (ECF subfamily) [Wenyingzhuangia heitensis]